jgi:hypothetical protein
VLYIKFHKNSSKDSKDKLESSIRPVSKLALNTDEVIKAPYGSTCMRAVCKILSKSV